MLDKTKVIYQIYPKSFKDTNQDGIGDIPGIIEKIPYLAELGIDMVWLNPIFPSPQNDNGYDISDYCALDPVFGTMSDFEEMIRVGSQYQIEFMFDMVLNHVSTEHSWFKKALAGDAYYQDFFILREQPTDWQSKFGGSAWSQFGDTNRYYLHLYDQTQADLNWRNENVRNALFDVVNFWMAKGIRGFRFDVINVIGKDEILKDNPENEGKAEYTDKPITHDYLKMMNQASFGKNPEIITVGEMSSTTIENCILYTAPERHELSMVFNFHHLKVDYADGKKWTIQDFDFHALKELFHSWGEVMSDNDGWNALFWNNHDQPRALNRFVDVKNYRVKGATMLASSIHLSRGTPYVYMGEEIGMLDPDFDSITDYIDVESSNAYQLLLSEGKSKAEAFEIIKAKSRDNSRIPMQWDNSKYAGFSDVKPWLRIGNTYSEINVEQAKTGEIFKYYQKLIHLRKIYPIIQEGTYHAFAKDSSEIYGFERQLGKQKLLVLNNFFAKAVEAELPEEYRKGTILISNYATEIEEKMILQPYQSIAILVE
ncbi:MULTISPECIES: alpha,alpha-phosphotrehalase [unclassified Enterococcus]|uniref:alpha,alpha-phosphotrehalase n=1 Tax=unclassified Enterococcus TaxID=2608891 RepID=UPI001558071E|nr:MULTISPECIES: alpha,alpha-phosphotrehalase [unclassified Enterococcus]MBS7575938.1 alpha,alpha-phosphotrehalase [Enterococcus sp. MMGLQ5-2]MBS7583171.1 alpha,alpha-phosphotrehalase [Enterococcus sp. MMGLQ5-1]NPD11031.1 alpha,alpha-phosphotrehalase [Enterococcus sp. MMGLQ5-1]NPD35774.1 alpha,alpha-phosphotrehalase [Enterococcus sp. MMGLQ5-2]